MNFANFIDLAAGNVPVKPAVGDASTLLTYSRLSEDTNAMANALGTLGVKPGERIAIRLPNCIEFLVAHLGAMKHGAIPVPINTQFTDDQVAYVRDSSDISVFISDENYSPSDFDVETLITINGSDEMDLSQLLADEPPEYTVFPRRNDEVAEVFYTSGTTGRPKGVRHTHGNLQANALGIINYLGLSRSDVGVTTCQCFHVIGLNVTTTPLIVAQAENRLLSTWDPETLLQTIENHGVTYAFFTPSMIIDLLEYDATARYDLSSLRVVGVGGTPMPKGRIADAEELFDCPLLEGYGMTETTPLAAFNRPDPATRKPGSVGKPAQEVVELRIEDPGTGEAVSQGERGELLWRGDTVSPGYEQHQYDQKSFLNRNGHMWLRSGDIGWLDTDGYLFIVDRIQDMFMSGCADVYPREIEDVLYDLEKVSEAAIIDTRDDLRGAVVTAIIIPTDDSLTAEEVQTACIKRLEDHEVPQRIEFVDKIPTTATGKIDRVVLRETFGMSSSS